MTDKSANLFGWDLLCRSVEHDIKNNQDVLVSFVHLVLVSNGFKCIGIGDSKNLDGSESKSESLPKGWNDGYALRYLYQGRLYNLKGTSLDDGIIINLIRVDERNVSMVQLNTRSVAQRSGSLDQMIPDSGPLLDIVKKQLIDKVVLSTKTRDSSSQTQSDQTRQQTGNQNLPRTSPFYGGPQHIPQQPLVVDPLNVGRSDLDPFGMNPLGVPPRPGNFVPGHGGGGGMLYVPPQGPRFDPNIGIPGGSIPPGARFDPFRPPDVDRFPRRPNNPDSDEMPPPGFDDMFM